MDDMTRFEHQFEDRVRAFARTGVRSVDSAAIARAVAAGRPRSAGTRHAWRWLGLTFDRRALAIALAIGLLATLLGGALLIGARLILPPFVDSRVDRLAYFLDGDIYVADWDGTNAARVVDGDADATCRVFVEGALISPDERHIAYRSNWGNGCQGAITVIDPDGHVVSTFPGDGWDIAWSPDSTRIATWLPEAEQMIGVYGIDGVLQVALDGSRTCCGDYDPVWSPDGSSLLIPTHDPVPGTMWELPVDGGAPRRVPAHDPRSHRQIRNSPDGTRAAFVDDGSLVVAAADGAGSRVLASGLEIWTEGPVWSPTGDRIAFSWTDAVFDAGANDTKPGRYELRVLDLASGAVTSLASVYASDPRPLRPITFSTEGDRILFRQADMNGGSSLWNVNTDGSGARLLVPGADYGQWLSLPADVEGSATP